MSRTVFSRLARIVSVPLLAGAVMVLHPGTASADTPTNGQQPNTVVRDPNLGPNGVHSQVGNCAVVSSSNYLGMSCPNGSKNTLTAAQILGPAPVPTCWDAPLNDSELNNLGLKNEDPPPGTWVWRFTLYNIDPKTKQEGPGGIKYSPQLLKIAPEDQDCKVNARQKNLFQSAMRGGNIPSPELAVSPTSKPRVGQFVSFFDLRSKEVTVRVGDDRPEVLRARPVHIQVKPLGAADPTTLNCAGIGFQAGPKDVAPDPVRPGDPCWYKYLRSSADQSDEVYPAKMTTSWVVEKSADGGATWQQFNQFDKSLVTNVAVYEIEALVVN